MKVTSYEIKQIKQNSKEMLNNKLQMKIISIFKDISKF